MDIEMGCLVVGRGYVQAKVWLRMEKLTKVHAGIEVWVGMEMWAGAEV
jgi:hypothetical protein